MCASMCSCQLGPRQQEWQSIVAAVCRPPSRLRDCLMSKRQDYKGFQMHILCLVLPMQVAAAS